MTPLAHPHVRLRLHAARLVGDAPQEEALADLADGAELALGGARLRVAVAGSRTAAGGERLDCTFTVVAGQLAEATVGVVAEYAVWSREEWVFLPACVYAGNRFPQVDRRSAPASATPDPDPVNWVTITSCPHLEHGPGPSRIHVLAGDCATPCVGVLSPGVGRGLLLITDQGGPHGDLGLQVAESDDRSRARILVQSPGVRQGGKYNWRGRLRDRGAELGTGASITVRVVVHDFPAATPEDLYARFLACRKELAPIRERHDLPFAHAFRLIEDKHNRDNWTEPHGYWSVGMREVASQDWQTGWVGGPNTIWPLLVAGDPVSVQRARRAWDFVCTARTPSGFVRGCFHQGAWKEDGGRCYLRYSADTLYFLMKTLLHLRIGPPHLDPPATWLELARGLAAGFARVWDEAGHLPHYVDGASGRVLVGGSCAAALAPAGLALAARYFQEPRWRTVAEAAARRYRDRFLARGLSNGGPGDIWQNVDSESAAALLESFVTLLEESQGAPEWLDAARRAAAYCATWVTSYDFRFPPDSTFGRLDMLTTGTVWANVQNKHAAPGICTLSGVALLKLWRAGGEACWLDLIRDIARCLPQHVSRADRPICDTRVGKRWKVMPPGWVNERVNLSDWEVRGEPWEEIGVGEIFGGSCWSEPAILNTVAEVPGLVLDTGTLALTVLDHVHAQVVHADPARIVLRLANPTRFPAAPVLLAEDAAERRSRWLGVHPLAGLPAIAVPPLAVVEHTVPRQPPVRMPAA